MKRALTVAALFLSACGAGDSLSATYDVEFGEFQGDQCKESLQTLKGARAGYACDVSVRGNIGPCNLSCFVPASDQVAIKVCAQSWYVMTKGPFDVRLFK